MKILLVQLSFLGDTVLSTPLIGALRRLHPTAELWMMTTEAGKELVVNDPEVKGVITFDKRGRERGIGGLLQKAADLKSCGFDMVYSLHRSWRTALLLSLSKIPVRIGFKQARLSFLYTETVPRLKGAHDVERNLSLLTRQGLRPSDAELRLFTDQGADLSKFGLMPKGYVVLVPGSVWHTKRWPLEGYREVAARLESNGERVVISGSASEAQLGEAITKGSKAINLAGKLSISELLLLIKQSRLVICNDSMALHVASAFKIPTVSIFCATSSAFGFGPWNNPRARVLEVENLSCRPCSRHGSDRCPTGTELCMRGITTSHVMDAARGAIDG